MMVYAKQLLYSFLLCILMGPFGSEIFRAVVHLRFSQKDSSTNPSIFGIIYTIILLNIKTQTEVSLIYLFVQYYEKIPTNRFLVLHEIFTCVYLESIKSADEPFWRLRGEMYQVPLLKSDSSILHPKKVCGESVP